MQASFWLVTAILVLPSVQALSLDGSAGSPSQMRGDVKASGVSWVLLVFNPGSAATFHVQAPAVETLTNHSAAWARFTGNPVFGGRWGGQHWESQSSFSGPLDADLTFGSRWSSLLVGGKDLRVQLEGSVEMLVVTNGAGPFSNAESTYRSEYRPCEPDPGTLVLRTAGEGPGTQVPVSMALSGVTRLEWHNATVTCPTVLQCPDGAGAFEIDAPTVRVLRMAYLEAALPDGTGQGTGSAHAIAAGGPSLSFGLDGIIRLPEVSLDSCTPAPCPAIRDKTLTLQGLAEAHIEPDSGRRLHLRMEATPTAAFSDEAPIPALVRAAAPVVGIALAAALAVKLLVGLAVRPIREPLAHPRRRMLYEAILAEPGISFRELMLATGIANGAALHHLRKLSNAGLIADQPHGRRRLFFENHGRYDRTWQAVAALRDEPTRLLHGWLLGNPRANQASVIVFSATHGWSRSATQKRLNRLVAQGLVQALRDGRQVTYVAQDAG